MATPPDIYVNDQGDIIIVGWEHWNHLKFVATGSAIPDSWTPLMTREAVLLDEFEQVLDDCGGVIIY